MDLKELIKKGMELCSDEEVEKESEKVDKMTDKELLEYRLSFETDKLERENMFNALKKIRNHV